MTRLSWVLAGLSGILLVGGGGAAGPDDVVYSVTRPPNHAPEGAIRLLVKPLGERRFSLILESPAHAPIALTVQARADGQLVIEPTVADKPGPRGARPVAIGETFSAVIPWIDGPPPRPEDVGGFVNEDALVRAMIGKPLPDFALSVRDPRGKSRRITKADLAGKVILLDIFAPPPPGIPFTDLAWSREVARSFTDARKDVAVIIACENGAVEDAAVFEKKVDQALKAEKIGPDGAPNLLVARDPTNSFMGGGQMLGYPSFIIVDRDGVVRSIHSGFSFNSEGLIREIKTLLKEEPKTSKAALPGSATSPSHSGTSSSKK